MMVRRFLTVVMSVLLMSLASQSVRAQTDELTAITVEGTSRAESAPEASRAIVASVTAAAARERIIEMIGEKAYQKNKAVIEKRIIRESYKFIPFVTPGTPEQTKDGWKMQVQMKVAHESLRQMIIANGLLFDVEGPASILPMVTFSDRIHAQRFRWWSAEKGDAKKFLFQVNTSLNQALFSEMSRKGFYIVRPRSGLLAGVLPEGFRGDRPRPEDVRFLGKFFNAQMIVRGDVRLRESTEISGGYQIAIKLSAVQTANQRAIAEVTRSYETEAGAFEGVIRSRLQAVLPEVAKDLAVQIVDVWQKGTLGSNLLRLSLRGQLSPRQISDLKAKMKKSVREIKSVRERIIEAGGITFEVDFKGGAQQFSDKLKNLSLPGYTLRLASSNEAGIVLDVRAP